MRLFRSARLPPGLLLTPRLIRSAGFWLTLIATGCGVIGPGNAATFPVTGTVLMDGQPLREGLVTLDPSGDAGVPTMGAVNDGQFSLQAAKGNYIVRFSATEVTGEKDEYGQPVSRPLIGEQYNSGSTLNAVVTSGENSLSFSIKGLRNEGALQQTTQ